MTEDSLPAAAAPDEDEDMQRHGQQINGMDTGGSDEIMSGMGPRHPNPHDEQKGGPRPEAPIRVSSETKDVGTSGPPLRVCRVPGLTWQSDPGVAPAG